LRGLHGCEANAIKGKAELLAGERAAVPGGIDGSSGDKQPGQHGCGRYGLRRGSAFAAGHQAFLNEHARFFVILSRPTIEHAVPEGALPLDRSFQLFACVLKSVAARKINLGRNSLRADNGDDPTRRLARCIFLYRPDQAGDGCSHESQRCLLTPKLGVASTSGFNRTGCFK